MKFFRLSLCLGLLSCISFLSIAQTNADYVLGEWNVLIKGTPNGDADVRMRFVMDDTTLKGFFVDPESGSEGEMSSVEFIDETLNAAFYIAGYDVTLWLKKENANSMKGSLMDMFDVEAKRTMAEERKSSDTYFLDSWNLLVEGTPNGDVVLPIRFEKGNDGKLKGYFTNPQDASEGEMSLVEIKDSTLYAEFHLMDYDLDVSLTKENEKTAKGLLMSQLNATATRVEK